MAHYRYLNLLTPDLYHSTENLQKGFSLVHMTIDTWDMSGGRQLSELFHIPLDTKQSI